MEVVPVLVVGLVDAVEALVHYYGDPRIGVEKPYDFLSFAGSVDMEAWNDSVP